MLRTSFHLPILLFVSCLTAISCGNSTTSENSANVITENKSFAIYVAFPDQLASPGKNDHSVYAKLSKMAGSSSLPVGHAGIILGDGKTGNTMYFDFGRFDNEEYQRTGSGVTRSGGQAEGLTCGPATFGEDGNPSNAADIVEKLVAGKDSWFAIHQYGKVEYAIYPDLNHKNMLLFAQKYGTRKYGFGKDGSYCAKFVNECIRAGGGEMPVIEEIVEEKSEEWLMMYISGASLEEIAQDGPVPTVLAKQIRERFPKENGNVKPLICHK